MRAIYTLLLFGLAIVISAAAYALSYERFERLSTQNSKQRLSLYEAGLQSTLERVAHLPRVIALHPNTAEVLRQGKSIANFNSYLKSVNDKAESAALYVLNAGGTTVAASNFDMDESFIGSNYKFRRYFTDAVKQGSGRFFAVGVNTGRPGYFLSEAINSSGDSGEVLGVAVVKVEFADLLKTWADAREDVLVTNADGVVVLASNPSRLYQMVQPISEERLAQMNASRKFSDRELSMLPFESDNDTFEGTIKLDGNAISVSTAETGRIGWRLHFLTPLDGVHASALAIAALAFLLCGLATIGFLYARSRMERTRLQIIAVEADRVREANVRLEKEIGERKRTEEQLRETQAELIQSTRLAALGQMSAAIVHEVNQPVSAIRTYTSSGRLLLKNRKLKDAGNVFSQIAKMTERLGAITSDLLIFSRKPVGTNEIVDLGSVVSEMVEELKLAPEASKVKFKQTLPRKRVLVTGSEHRFQQLVGNLLKNAVQASQGQENPTVIIKLASDAGRKVVKLSVEDNGTGVDEQIVDQLFDPFFTTKDVGKGVGLGLALSYAIVQEAGGRIACENREEGGARFVVELPLVEKTSSDKQPVKEIQRV